MVGFRDEHGVAERGRQRCEWRQGHWATEWHPDSLYDPAGGVGSVASARKGPLSSRGGSSGRRPLRGVRQRPGRTRGWKNRRAWLWKTLIYRAGVTQFSSSNEKPVLLPFTPLRAPSSANPGAARGLVRTRPSRARGPFSRVGPTPVTFPLCDLVIFLCLLLEKSLLK